MKDTHGLAGEGWYGFDLDGTLAKYDGWKGIDKIGEPIHSICSLAKALHDAGHIVKIVTARVSKRPLRNGEFGEDFKIASNGERIYAGDYVRMWCGEHLGFLPAVTDKKDGLMLWLFDDHSVQVEKNTGRILGDIPEEIRHLFPGMTTYRICFQDTDPDGEYSTVNVKVEVRSLLSIKGVNHLINLSMRDLKYSDYNSADEYVEAIMENSGVDEWNFLSPEMDSYFELNS